MTSLCPQVRTPEAALTIPPPPGRKNTRLKTLIEMDYLSLETITKLEAALGISLIQVPEFKSKAKTQVTTEEYTAFSSGTEITTEFHLESGETEEWDGDDEPEVRGAA